MLITVRKITGTKTGGWVFCVSRKVVGEDLSGEEGESGFIFL
jgi:hypothetical protein